MENKNINYGFPKKIVAAFSFALIAVNFLVACSNGGGKNQPPPPVIVPCNTIECQQAISGQTLIVAPSISPLKGDWVLSGDANLVSQQRMMNPVANIFNIYQGPLTLSGTIITADLASYSGTCTPLQSMIGTGFSFSTIVPGVAAYGTFVVPQVQASSGIGSFTFEVHNGMLYDGKFSADLVVTSVNGIQCRSFPIAVF